MVWRQQHSKWAQSCSEEPVGVATTWRGVLAGILIASLAMLATGWSDGHGVEQCSALLTLAAEQWTGGSEVWWSPAPSLLGVAGCCTAPWKVHLTWKSGPVARHINCSIPASLHTAFWKRPGPEAAVCHTGALSAYCVPSEVRDPPFRMQVGCQGTQLIVPGGELPGARWWGRRRNTLGGSAGSLAKQAGPDGCSQLS